MYYFTLAGKYPDISDPEPSTAPAEGNKPPPPAWMGWKDNSNRQSEMLEAWEARNK